MADDFLQDRLCAIEARIIAYEEAMVALNDGVQEYTIDTGQTRQKVTRYDLGEIERQYQNLLNLRGNLRLRCGLDVGTFNGEGV